MNTRYVVPVVFAAAFHGALLFGFPRSPRSVSPNVKEPTDSGCRLLMPSEELEVVLVSPDELVERKGEDLAHPTSVEPERVAWPDIDQPVMAKPRVVIGPIGDAQRIVEIGNPHGSIDGKIKTDGILTAIALDNPPRTRFQTSPIYPYDAKKAGLTGEVLIDLSVDEHGNVVEAKVVRSSDRVFEEPTLRAVVKWKFEPGRRHGRVVAFRMTAPVVFSLHE